MTPYSIIYLDPPWHYNSRANHKTRFRGGVHGHYPTMTMDEIKALPVPDLAAPAAAVLMWCTYPYLDEQIRLFKHWGFRYRTIFVNWVKLNPKGYWSPHADPNYGPDKQYVRYGDMWHSVFFGVGYYAKSNTEPLLLGMRGQLPTRDNTVSSVILAPRREHSRKPDEARERITQVFGALPRLEMFARQKADGWHSWGNTVANDIDLEAA
jgi:N6-adenosine-specific RNA methylase IME4